MALPRFERSGLSTLTFSRAYLATSGRKPPKPRQKVGRSDAGTWEVLTLGEPDQQIPLEFSQLPLADVEALDTFLGPSGVNFAALPFTFVDIDSTETEVRALDYDYSPVTPDSFNVTILLVVEPS
jgi:hypothetical protein